MTAPGAGTPTGNVTVTVSGGAETCTGTVAAGTCSITLTALGARTLTATYAGDANFNTSASAGTAHQVNASATTTAVASSVNPSTFGQSVTFTATVTSGATPVTVGSVTFIEGGTCAAPTTTLQAATALNGSGQVTYTTSALSGGSHTITACYGASGSFAASNGNVVQTVNAAATALAVSPATGTFGGNVALSATLTSGGNPVAGKLVAFTLNGTAAGTATTNASGVASIASAALGSINAGTYPTGVGASFAGDASFATSSGTASLTVNPKATTLTLTTVPATVVYGGSATFMTKFSEAAGHTINFTIDGTGVGSDNTNGGGNASVTVNFSSFPAIGVGSHNVTATFAGETNLATSTDTKSFTVTPAAATVALTNLSQTYDGTPKSATVTTTPNGLSTSVTYNGSATAPTNAGSYAVVATITDPNYSGSASGTLVIAKASQTISFAALANKTFGDPAFSVSATATSGLTVTFAVGASDKCTIAGSTVTLTGAGSCTVTASQAGDANYNAAAPVAQSFTIAPAAATVTLNGLSQTYDGTPRVVTATTSPAGLTVTITYDGSATAPTNAGSYAVVGTISDPNYTGSASGTLVVGKADQTITFAALTDKTLGDPDFTVSATASSSLTVTFAASGSCTVTGNSVHLTAAGSCTVTASQAGNANYNAAPSVDRPFTIAKGQATLALSDLSHTYDGTPKSATVTTTPAGLTVVSVTYDGSATAPTNAGSYAVVASLDNANYQATDATGTLVIAKAAQTINFAALSEKTFGDAPFSVSATGGGSGNAVTFSSTTPTTCSVSGSTVTLEAAGSCTIAADQAGNANYEAAAQVTQSFTIAKGAATLALSDLSHTYDGTPKSATVTTTPSGLTGVSVTYDGSATAPTNAGSYAVVASLTNANYQATDATGTLVIAKATQTINFAALADRTFGDADFSVSATATSGLAVTFAASGKCTVAGSDVHLTGAGSCTITASQAGNQNYEAAANVEQSFSIAKASQTIVFAPLGNKTFGDAPFGLSATGGASGNAVVFASTTPGTCSVSSSTVTIEHAGSCTITANQAGNDDYNMAAEVSHSFTIAKAAATLTLSDLTHTYDGSPKAATVTVSPSGLSVVSVTYDGSATAPTNAGSYAVVASLTNDDYDAPDATGTLTIQKASQTITFAALTNKTFGDPDFALSASASSGLAVTFASTTPGTCSVSSSTVTIEHAGSCTITANQAGNANYEAALEVSHSFTINKAAATLALSNLTQTYDGSPKSATVTTTPAGLSGVSVTYDGSATAPTNAGSYAVVASLTNQDYVASDATGTLTVNKAAATVVLNGLTQTYDGAPRVVTATTTPAGLTVEITYDGSATAPTNAGSYAIAATVNDPNYEGSTTGTLVVNKADQTIAFAALADRTFGDPDFSVSATATSGLGVSFAASGKCTVSVNNVHLTGAGSCSITASQAGDGNYNAAPDVIQSFSIAKASQAIAFAALADKTFGDAPFALSATGGASGNAVVFASTTPGTCSVSGTTATILHAGGCTITANQAGNDDYEAALEVSRSFTINKAPATLALSNLSYGYDATPKSATVTTTPSGLSGVSVTYDGSPTAPTNAGSYAVVASLTNQDYQATDATGTLVIDKAPLTITAANKTQVYGDPAVAFTVAYSGFAGSEGPSALGGTLVFTGSATTAVNVGSYVITPGGLTSSNYEIGFVDGTLSITTRPVTVTADALTKGYGDPDPAFTYTLTSGSLASGDAFSGALTRVAGETVASSPYAINQGTLVLNANYALAFNPGSLAITKKDLTVVADNKSKLYGASVPALTGTLSGVVSGDNITASYLAGTGGIVTASTAVGLYPIIPVLADPDGKLTNYNLTSTNGQLTITQAPLAVTADPKSRQYGAANPAFTATVSGFVLGQSLATSGVTGAATFSGAGPSAGNSTPVGTYAITPAAGTLSAPNYTFLTANGASFVNALLTITQATSTTVAAAVSAPYSETGQNVTLTATVTGSTPPAVGEGTVKFTLKNGAVPIGSPVTVPVAAGAASATYAVPAMTDVGNYSILAEYTSGGNYTVSNNTGTLTIQPGNLEDETATTDADFRHVDGVDALFKKDGNLTTLRLQNTNPGTVHYQLTLKNVTGVVIDAATGSTAKTILEVPAITSCGSISCPSAVLNGPAWVLKAAKAVHVHPDDKTDDMPVQLSYKASGTCTDETGYVSSLASIPTGAPKCIRVTGYAIPKRERARLDVHFEFRWKDTGGWSSSPDAKLYFRSGFAFKSTTTVNFPVAPSVRTSIDAAGLVVAGQRVTAMGGFAFNSAGAPSTGYLIRAFNLQTDASCTIAGTDPRVVAQDVISADGFYFIWKKGTDQMNTAAVELPSKVKYYLQVCNGVTPVTGHLVKDKLVDKEFDEEDFDVP